MAAVNDDDKARYQALFAKADADGNGEITVAEMRKLITIDYL